MPDLIAFLAFSLSRDLAAALAGVACLKAVSSQSIHDILNDIAESHYMNTGCTDAKSKSLQVNATAHVCQ